MLHAKFLGEHAGVEGGAVVFLVGIEHETVLVEAEGLAHQPVAVAGIGFALHAVGLIAQADEALPVGQLGLEAVLLEVGRGDVKEGDLHVVDGDQFPIMHLAQDDRVADRIEDFARYHQRSHRQQRSTHLVVAVDGERPLVLALVDEWRNFAYHPDGAHDVVGVAVGDEHVSDALEGDFGSDELPQDAVAATAVNQQPSLRGVQIEAGVVAVHAHGVARAQHRDA